MVGLFLFPMAIFSALSKSKNLLKLKVRLVEVF